MIVVVRLAWFTPPLLLWASGYSCVAAFREGGRDPLVSALRGMLISHFGVATTRLGSNRSPLTFGALLTTFQFRDVRPATFPLSSVSSQATTSFGENVLGVAGQTAARRNADPDLALRPHLCHHTGQCAAVSEFVPVHRRYAGTGSRPAARVLRRAERDDAQTPPHPRPKPGPPHRHRTPPKSPRPHHPARRVHERRRAGPTRDRTPDDPPPF